MVEFFINKDLYSNNHNINIYTDCDEWIKLNFGSYPKTGKIKLAFIEMFVEPIIIEPFSEMDIRMSAIQHTLSDVFIKCNTARSDEDADKDLLDLIHRHLSTKETNIVSFVCFQMYNSKNEFGYFVIYYENGTDPGEQKFINVQSGKKFDNKYLKCVKNNSY